MKVTTTFLEKMYRTVFYASIIGLMAAMFLPWLIVDAFDRIVFLNQITLYNENNVDHELNYISLLITVSSIGYWGSIVFSTVGFIGIGYRKIEENIRSKYLMIGSIPLLCFSVVVLVPNILIWVELLSYDFFYRHSFNFIPLVMSVVMLVCSSILVVIVGKPSFLEVLKLHENKKETKTNEDSNHEIIDDSNEECSNQEYHCPNCDVELKGEELLCPECNENISKRCASCEKLISSFKDVCPRCGSLNDEGPLSLTPLEKY